MSDERKSATDTILLLGQIVKFFATIPPDEVKQLIEAITNIVSAFKPNTNGMAMMDSYLSPSDLYGFVQRMSHPVDGPLLLKNVKDLGALAKTLNENPHYAPPVEG